jgi:hypothetical protein
MCVCVRCCFTRVTTAHALTLSPTFTHIRMHVHTHSLSHTHTHTLTYTQGGGSMSYSDEQGPANSIVSCVIDGIRVSIHGNEVNGLSHVALCGEWV